MRSNYLQSVGFLSLGLENKNCFSLVLPICLLTFSFLLIHASLSARAYQPTADVKAYVCSVHHRCFACASADKMKAQSTAVPMSHHWP